MKFIHMYSVMATLLIMPTIAVSYQIETDLPDEIKAQCQIKWPGDYRMQEYCMTNQTESAIYVIKAYQAAGKTTEKLNIIKHCLHKWRQEPIKTEYSFDYKMTAYCVDKQTAAYSRIYSTNSK